MADGDRTRAPILEAFEAHAEWLFVHHLDLLAQIEAHLRAVHHTMRRIERLRGPKLRVGAEPTNGERGTVLKGLSEEIAQLDAQVSEQRQCCNEMQATITDMEQYLQDLKRVAANIDAAAGPESDTNGGGSLSA
jgi:hypothetical protein